MTKDNCNLLYEQALNLMESNSDVDSVRNAIIKTAEALIELGKEDISLAGKCNAKAGGLIRLAKDIRISKSYNDAYLKLTGKELKKNIPVSEVAKKIEEAIVKPVEQQPINEIREEEPVKKEIEKSNNKKPKKNNPKEDNNSNMKFNWDTCPNTSFNDVAGLQDVKDEVKKKVILPLVHPDLYEGYVKQNGGGLLLYGPPGTGKTMIAAAIAHEIGAKFCSLGPSDLLTTGVGNSEKAIAELFREARSFKCAIIFFDEIESLCPVSTHAQHARQIRSELLRQMQGLDSYSNDSDNILYLIAATNKPWDIDPAFVRPGRFGTRVYVDLPDDEARGSMILNRLAKINEKGKVAIESGIDYSNIIYLTKGYNGADMANLLDEVQQYSIDRALLTGEKTIKQEDFSLALEKITSSVQQDDIDRLHKWRSNNG